jgi:transposase
VVNRVKRSEAVWREIHRRFERSGMSVAQFCEVEGCSVATFYAWRKRLADSPHQSFAEVLLDEPSEAAIEIELSNAVRLRLVGAVDARQLRTVLDCLGQRPC